MTGSGWCQTCDGYTKPWCGHGQTPPPGPCAALVLVPLVMDDIGGEKPCAFPRLKRDGHTGLHLAHIEWGDSEPGAPLGRRRD